MTKPKRKACHNKTYYATYNGEGTCTHALSKRKSQFDTRMTPSSAHSRVRKSLTKQNCFKIHHNAHFAQKQSHAAVSGPVDSMHFFKCIFFILWTLTVLCSISPFGTCQGSVYFPIFWLEFVKFTVCFPLPGSQAAAARSVFGVIFSVTLCLASFPTPQPIILCT